MSNANYMYFRGQAVPERDKYRTLKGGGLPNGDTVIDQPGVIGYGEYFSICGYRVSGAAWDLTIQYRVLLSHDGITSGSKTEQFANPHWGPWQGLAALTNVTGDFDVAIDPIVSDGIQLKVTNNGADIIATLPQDVPNADGDGACILVKYWS